MQKQRKERFIRFVTYHSPLAPPPLLFKGSYYSRWGGGGGLVQASGGKDQQTMGKAQDASRRQPVNAPRLVLLGLHSPTSHIRHSFFFHRLNSSTEYSMSSQATAWVKK